MLYVLRNPKFPENRILIGAKDKVQMWGRLKQLLVKKPSYGTLFDWHLERELPMPDWCCWVY